MNAYKIGGSCSKPLRFIILHRVGITIYVISRQICLVSGMALGFLGNHNDALNT
jgi:hypothetical protein